MAAGRSTYAYSRIRTEAPDDSWSRDQFKQPEAKAPIKEIQFAAALLLGGILLLTLGIMVQTGYFDAEFDDRGIPLLVIGSIMFIPGFYHVRLAWYAYKKYPGFRFQDIPRFDEYS